MKMKSSFLNFFKKIVGGGKMRIGGVDAPNSLGGETVNEKRGFGGVEAPHSNMLENGGEKMVEKESGKMEKPVDFVLEACKSVGLENMCVRVRAEPYYEEEEATILDILDFIWTYGQTTGGFLLQVEDGVPEFIVIECGYTPNEFSWYYYSRSETLVTDGQTVFISRFVDSDGNTHHDEYYKYRLTSATFAMVIGYEENNFNGENRYLHVFYYGDKNSKLVNVLRRLNDLLAP
jgi:hypothetical protein